MRREAGWKSFIHYETCLFSIIVGILTQVVLHQAVKDVLAKATLSFVILYMHVFQHAFHYFKMVVYFSLYSLSLF